MNQLSNLVLLPPRPFNTPLIEKWERIDTWIFLDVLVGLREVFQNSRRFPDLWHQVSHLLSQRGIFKSHDKCRNRWKVLVAKYKRFCGQTLRNGAKLPSFEFSEPLEILLAGQLKFDGESLVRTFKNGSQVKLAAVDSDLAPIRRLSPRHEFFTGDPWSPTSE